MFAIDLLEVEGIYRKVWEHILSPRLKFCKAHSMGLPYNLPGREENKEQHRKVNSRYSSIDFFVTSFDLKSFCGSYPDDWRAKEKVTEDKAVEKKLTFFPKNENEMRGYFEPFPNWFYTRFVYDILVPALRRNWKD